MAEKNRPKKHCYFKSNQIPYVDYKDVGLLTRFLTDQGKILPRRITGVSAFYQRQLSRAVKTARQMGLIAATLSGDNRKRTPGGRGGPRGPRSGPGGPGGPRSGPGGPGGPGGYGGPRGPRGGFKDRNDSPAEATAADS